MGLIENLLAAQGIQNPGIDPAIEALLGGGPAPAPGLPLPSPELDSVMNAQPPEPEMSGRLKTKNAVKGFVGDLMFTLGETLKAGASAPGGRGANLATAAALQTPYLLESLRAQQQAQAQQAAIEQQERKTKADQEWARIGLERIKEIREQKKPPPTEAYTLSPGQKRFENGKLVAENTEKDRPRDTVVIGRRLINKETGEVVAEFKDDTPEKRDIVVVGRRLVDRQTGEVIKEFPSDEKPSTDGLIQAVMENPGLYNQLTPTMKAAIAPELSKKDFAGFGKPLSDTAIKEITLSKSAIASLRDLRQVLTENEQYLGPLAGLQAVNPYSEGRKAQARIDAVRQRVGKALEGGVLRKEDEEKYKKILATLRDEPSTALYKVDSLIIDIERDLNTYMDEQSKAGRATGGSGGAPKVGDEKTFPNGKKGRWDGTGWVEIK